MVSGRRADADKGAGAGARGHLVALTSGLQWHEMIVGARFVTPARTILASEIRSFVNLAGMTEPLFTNALRGPDGVLKGDLCPGAYLFSVAEGLVLNGTVRDTGLALLSVDMSLRAPTRAGDTIAVEIEVIAARRTRQKGRGIVATRNTVRKADGTVVLEYDVTRMVAGR